MDGELRSIYEITTAPYGKVVCTLKSYLKKRKISRTELAKTSGVGYGVVNRYYRNEAFRYDGDVISKFCYCLNCTISDLLVYIPDEGNSE